MTELTNDELTNRYIQLRDMKTKINAETKKQLDPINEGMEKIERILYSRMTEQGVLSMRTTYGTPYISTKRSYKVVDPDVLRAFVINNNAWGILDLKVDKKEMDALVEEGEVLPPGIEMSTFDDVNCKRNAK